ncbi:MAG: TerB family tellurite resistance protein [Gloeomargarita sp. SKYB31]|nr:TerB family tellurite resistance protein [Gloeomargarita sp. SKYB31]
MSNLTPQEALACIKVLVFMARADGIFRAEEEEILLETCRNLELPADVSLLDLVRQEIDLEAELAKITSPAAREQVYAAALAMACADRNRSVEEREVLARIQNAFRVPHEKTDFIQRLMADTRSTLLPANIAPISDPAERERRIEQLIQNYAIFTAVLGAFPIPGLALVTDIAVLTFQLKMIEEIGRYWGYATQRKDAELLRDGMMGGVGISVFRIAVSNAAKLVPGWGSVVGASLSYASTWAIGKVANQYYASGGKLDIQTLQDAFKQARQEGEKEYQKNRALIQARQQAHAAQIEQLNQQLQKGEITQADYEQKLQELSQVFDQPTPS